MELLDHYTQSLDPPGRQTHKKTHAWAKASAKSKKSKNKSDPNHMSIQCNCEGYDSNYNSCWSNTVEALKHANPVRNTDSYHVAVQHFSSETS